MKSLEARQVSFSRDGRIILEDISCSLRSGEIVGLINADSAKHAGLALSSKLMSLARHIHREGGR
ncbi:hypothetical protein LDC_0382 [sediment metagenome]|uniref:Uncharacterized protein n=1 Tax=sediment metagenome TaxID=749907 RepID=D9PFT7_9ZZZZ